jgi:hypothetical protein
MWATHVTFMQTLSQAALLGYVELQVGSLAVQVPIRAAGPAREGDAAQPLASFAVEGDACAILVRGDKESAQVEKAVALAAREALRHLSHKLLN